MTNYELRMTGGRRWAIYKIAGAEKPRQQVTTKTALINTEYFNDCLRAANVKKLL